MKQFVHLLKHDFMLLYRNKMVGVSIFITMLYILTFRGLSTIGNVDILLIIMIFNDPALVGFLFIGVSVLFEKNESTIQALAVSPIKVSNYILSKSIALTIISLCCCFAMIIAAKGIYFNVIHFFFASVFTTLIFSFIGFVVVAGQSNFNKYILKAIGIIILLSIPFVSYFGLVHKYWFLLFPTMPMIDMFSLSLPNTMGVWETIVAYSLSILWCIVSYLFALKVIIKNFAKQ